MGWRCLVAVGQRAQKRNHIADLALVERRPIAAPAVERRIGIDVVPVPLRQIVELVDASRYDRIEPLGVRIPFDIKMQDLLERSIDAIVEKSLSRRDVAQRRRAKEPAEFAAPGRKP